MKILIKLLKKHFILLTFVFVAFLVITLIINKKYFSKSYYLYIRVKIGQGLWWASTTEPSLRLINSIKDNIQHQPDIKLYYYPIQTKEVNYQSNSIDRYVSYLDLKLKVNKTNNSYLYNRSAIAIGAPIDIDFNQIQISGTIMSFSPSPIIDQYIEKTIYLTKNNPNDWEYNAVKINDYYHNGVNKVFIIIDKQNIDGNLLIKAKIKLKLVNNQLIFGEDQTIAVNKKFYLFTQSFIFDDYSVSQIED